MDDAPVVGRGLAVAGFEGAAAACGWKFVVLPDRPDVLAVDPPELLSVGRGVGVELDAGERPGALGRLVPPLLAAARAAAASVGLEDGRLELVFRDAAGLGFADAGGLENDEPGRGVLDGVVETGRVPLEERGGWLPDVGRLLPEPDPEFEEGDGWDGAADLAGAAENDDEDRPLEPDGDDGVENADADFFTVGASAEPLSERSVGRTRVVSSEASALGSADSSADAALAEASVLIGVFPSPGFGRDDFSDRWLWSELTSHLHAQAVDEEPSADSTLNHWH